MQDIHEHTISNRTTDTPSEHTVGDTIDQAKYYKESGKKAPPALGENMRIPLQAPHRPAGASKEPTTESAKATVGKPLTGGPGQYASAAAGSNPQNTSLTSKNSSSQNPQSSRHLYSGAKQSLNTMYGGRSDDDDDYDEDEEDDKPDENVSLRRTRSQYTRSRFQKSNSRYQDDDDDEDDDDQDEEEDDQDDEEEDEDQEDNKKRKDQKRSSQVAAKKKDNGNEIRRAISILKCDEGKGTIFFKQACKTCPVDYRIRLNGLKQGKHGFHIHEFGDLSNGCDSAGSHFNPEKKNHGGPDSKERHFGDLGNINISKNGDSNEKRKDKLISLWGSSGILGRSVVIHADEDDYGLGGHSDSLTTGHSGKRICCGVVGLAGDRIDSEFGDEKESS